MNEDISVWVALLKDVGFPAVITVYLLIRFEKKIDKLSNTIEGLKKVIKTANKKGE